jgi:4,5-dihydroxyphthalate decarboxylase
MGNIELGLALSDNGRTAPIHAGAVKAEGIDLHVTKVHPSEMFWRQLHFKEFEVSEMSMSSLLAARSRGDMTWVGLPVFTSRQFFHTGILVREDAHISTPADLKGKRVGVPEYQQTAALWTRGVLLHEFGVSPEDLHWFMERPPEQSHGGATGFTPPKGVQLEYMSRDSNIGAELMSGGLDATLLYIADRNLVDRSRADLSLGAEIHTLFPDRRAEAVRYYQKTKNYPINHCVVVRSDIVEAYPWVVLNLYSMFLEAKHVALSAQTAGLAPYIDTGLIDAPTAKALSTDLFTYGVASQRDILETITLYSYEQGLTPRQFALDELFYPPTLEL